MIAMTNPTTADMQSYLAQRQQQQADIDRFNNLPRRDPDEADAVRAGLDAESANLTEQQVELVGAFEGVINDAVSARMAAVAGDLDIADARKQLLMVQNRLATLRRRKIVLAQRAQKVQEQRQDPAAEAARLIDKYPALRRG